MNDKPGIAEEIRGKPFLEPGDKVRMIRDTSFTNLDDHSDFIIKRDEVGEVVSYGSSSAEPEPWYGVEFGDRTVDITVSQQPKLLEMVERWQDSEIERITKERDFYKEDRDRCERLERKAYQQLQQLREELEQVNKRLDEEILTASMQREVIRHAGGERESLRSQLTEMDKRLRVEFDNALARQDYSLAHVLEFIRKEAVTSE